MVALELQNTKKTYLVTARATEFDARGAVLQWDVKFSLDVVVDTFAQKHLGLKKGKMLDEQQLGHKVTLPCKVLLPFSFVVLPLTLLGWSGQMLVADVGAFLKID
ncbi:hypothetical protein Fot_10727 [Forsythia ovata]|uniref:Uncharacterized protein n=1 Tax=Forsythia ovata TaxID=205694 RepID=A0ABD1WI12_9LAMI